MLAAHHVAALTLDIMFSFTGYCEKFSRASSIITIRQTFLIVFIYLFKRLIITTQYWGKSYLIGSINLLTPYTAGVPGPTVICEQAEDFFMPPPQIAGGGGAGRLTVV